MWILSREESVRRGLRHQAHGLPAGRRDGVHLRLQRPGAAGPREVQEKTRWVTASSLLNALEPPTPRPPPPLSLCSPSEHVVALDAQIIVAVSCGESHTLALNDKGQVFSWGLGSDGQLGLNNFEECVRVPR